MRAYLAIDVGTSAAKAGVVTSDGALLASAAVPYELSYPSPGHIECEADTYWDATVQALRRAVADGNAVTGGALEIAGIGSASQGETLLCLGRRGEPIGPAIVWLDTRATAEAAWIGEQVGTDVRYEHTGQAESVATWPAAMMRWLSIHEPDRFAATYTFATLGDWIGAQLCGELTASTTMWSTSLLLDVISLRWWDTMLELTGVDEHRLPRLVGTMETIGGVTEEVAACIGVPGGIPVMACTLDQIAGAVGVGNVVPGEISEMSGTCLALAATVESLPPRELGLPIYLHAEPGKLCALPYAQTGGLLLQWLRSTVSGGQPGSVAYEQLLAEAAAVPPGSSGVLFLPHLAGAFFPEFDHQARGAIVGLTLQHGRGHIVRSALEAVSFVLRSGLERLNAAGVRSDEVIAAGGGMESALWLQIKADVCGVRLRRARCAETALLGAAMLLAVALGDYPSCGAATLAMTGTSDSYIPDLENKERYDEAFARYGALTDMLQPFWPRDGVPVAITSP